MVDFNKNDTALTDNNIPIDILTMELSWEQQQAKGLLGRMTRRGVDIDANVILFDESGAVDFVGPEHLVALSGHIHHHGDVKRGSGEGAGEVVTFGLANILDRDADIVAMAITAACKTGNFSSIASAAARFYHGDSTSGDQLGVVRFPILGDHIGMILAKITRRSGYWQFTKVRATVDSRDWRALGTAAAPFLRT